MKALVIAEKPSVARDIARVLKCQKNIQGAMEGSQYIVTWALGHLVTLADPEGYDKKYKEWKMEYLPMMPKKMELVVIKQTSKQYQAVKTQLYRKDVNEIIIATDAGREGELVARWILEKAGCHKPIKRLWISSVTDKAIREGFAHLKDGREYNNLYAAAVSRAEADWLVGINATRALTCKYNAQLSCGRVQTPTLAMIAKREEEIRNFKPEEYYGISLQAGKVKWTWQDQKSGSYRSFQKERMEQLAEKLKRGTLSVHSIERAAKKTLSPGLYDLTELQRDANKKFGFSAKETLNIMQRLYENHKVLTYPRTDSRYIGTDVVGTIKERLKACSVGPYKKLAGSLIMKPIQTNKSFVDDKKVSDHHAIIPTEQFVQMDHMTNEERKIYDLVVRRFLAVLYPPFVYEQTTMKATVEGENFLARGKIVKEEGWKAVYETVPMDDEEEEENDSRGTSLKEQMLPEVKKGEKYSVQNLELTKGKTKPPAPFNEATLLSAMENPVKYMDSRDAAAVKTLGETGGLGTVATRADIIEKLFNSFLMEKRGKDIFITSKAKQLLELVPEDLKKPELTADWEMKLSRIAKGTMKKEVFLANIRDYTQDIIGEIRQGDGTFRHDNLTNTKCPVCGKRMLAVNGKNSRMLVCQDRECGHRETVSKISNARCPNCHKKMELYMKGKEETFICSCGYKEKLSSFKARREKEGAGVSKKDVQRYLQEQKKEAKEPINNAFADALAKLNLK
ncbi:DNA topoisomerase III [Lactonifactor longoviformis]|uniref:DNA topoisomerase 3 n=1 Tax=Lactonifactor longoviformis DSM 17459 TaxID=1122155 RepID=A0A1M5B046_9CLOT|nr:DNA topoisomerase III [Lactonifactor longoviformis]POP31350.1 DNA topoisomerase III [Lactonifactor longoviformis]SHF35820.1 DNA topoisomerase-3 [Lactonifactor longoviformis DSM 17459]